MKTYLLDTYNRYKRYSESLDVKTKLCNRSWVVFNDGGEREVYKFKEEGKLLISLSGAVSIGTWEYDPSDQTLLISASGQSFMVHPGLYESVLLCLQLDGTNNCVFLIEDNNAQKFAPKTYTELLSYFEEKEKQYVLAEQKQLEQKQLEDKRRKQQDENEILKWKHTQNLKNDFYSYFSAHISSEDFRELQDKMNKEETCDSWLLMFSTMILMCLLVTALIFLGLHFEVRAGAIDILVVGVGLTFLWGFLINECMEQRGYFIFKSKRDKYKRLEEIKETYCEQKQLSYEDREQINQFFLSY